MKRLILCRHAKSSWKNITGGDIDRRLHKRGKQDALIMGRRLLLQGMYPDAIITSPAARARKTAARLAKEINFSKKEIIVVKLLYGALIAELFAFVHQLNDSWTQVMIIGHNPEMTIFANSLADLNIFNIPTCGIVCLDFRIDYWKEVKKKSGELVFFDYPKRAAEAG